VLNALAAIVIATEVGIPDSAIQRALENFQGIDRRLQVVGEPVLACGQVTIIDDYGHHPTELSATLEAVRQGWPNRRIVLAFQPHRYTRTRDLLDDFADVLSRVDVVLVTEVYAAGEEPIRGADGRAICRAIRTRGRVEPVFVPKVDDLSEALSGLLREGDVVVTMGAGHIGTVAQELGARLLAGGAR
jgi:UDP-N-acetylmuramate--alanine ligase